MNVYVGEKDYLLPLCNVVHHPLLSMVIGITSRQTGITAEHHLSPLTYDDMDFVDQMSAYDTGYWPDQFRETYGSIWVARRTVPLVFLEHLALQCQKHHFSLTTMYPGGDVLQMDRE